MRAGRARISSLLASAAPFLCVIPFPPLSLLSRRDAYGKRYVLTCLVGPATAKKIIAGRPYATVADLSKAGVPKGTIDKITSMVTVGSAAPAAAPKAAPTMAPAPAAAAPAAAPAKPAGAPVAAQQPPVKGMVWVNLDSKVFHREGDRYYGTTKNGKFMTEADAVKAGYREAKSAAKPKK